MKQKLSPGLVYSGSILFYALVAYICLQFVMQMPWLGIGFKVDSVSGELRASYIDSDGAAFSVISPNDTIKAIHGGGNSVILNAELIKGMPYDLKTYENYNQFFNRQTLVTDILKEDSIIIEINDDSFFELIPKQSRPLNAVPVMFWLQLLIGGAVFFVSMSVLAYGTKDMFAVNVCFAMVGLSFLLYASVVAIYSNREIALDGTFFTQLAMIQYFSALAFISFFVVIFSFYPIHLKETNKLLTVLAGLSIFSVVHVFQLVNLISLGVYFLFYIIGLLGIFFIVLQYRYTKRLIVERASLRWLVYALITGDVLFFIISILPLITSLDLIHKQFFYWVALLCVYIGIALGLKKYKLFKLELWALYSWVWMFGSLVVLGLSVVLTFIFDISSLVALLLSILIVGWLYFPLRQWLWANYAFGFNRTQYQERLPELLEIILSPKAVRSNKEQWGFLLRQVFEPVLVMNETDDSDDIKIKESGAVLHVPEFEGIPALALAGVERGSRLFNANDVSFLESMMTLFKNAQEFKGAYEQGVHEERLRIARDLHDDVAARLLTLIHKSEGTPQEPLAREALVTLRESINSLGGRKEQSLNDLLSELKIDINFRLDAANIKLIWEQDRKLYKIRFSSRQTTNFKRVATEITTNILKHANAKEVKIVTSLTDSEFILSVCDDGEAKLMKDWINGRGVNNIRTRMKESGGSVRWNQRIIDEQLAGTCVEVSIPV